MRKTKLLLVACALIGASATAWAEDEDYTSRITNANLASTEGWTLSATGGNWSGIKGSDPSFVIEAYAGWGGLDMTAYSMKQNVTLPSGKYRAEGYAFYRYGEQAGTDPSKSYAKFVAGDFSAPVVTLGGETLDETLTAYPNDVDQASAAFTNGYYKSQVEFAIESESSISFGYEGTHTLMRSWFIAGPIKLYRTGDFDYSLYQAQLESLVDDAKALQGKTMATSISSALDDVVTKYDGESCSSVADYNTAYGELNTAITNATNSISVFAEAKEILDAANGYDEAGQASYAADETISAIQSAYSDGTLTELTNEQKAAAKAALATACKAQSQPADGCDMSAFIVNPGIDGNTDGWTTTKEGNGYMGGPLKPSNDAMEFWGASTLDDDAASKKFNYYQTIKELPNGVYTISAAMLNSTNGEEGATWNAEGQCGLYGKSIAGEEIVLVTTDSEIFTEYTTGNIIVADGIITIGVKNIAPLSGRWFAVDNFKLTYVRKLTDEDYAAALAPAKEAWGKALADAQSAYNAHEAAQSFPEGVTLSELINGSEPSDLDGYSAATLALEEATTAFTASAPSYESYAAYKAETETLFGTDFNVSTPTTAAEAINAVHELNIAQYNEVADNYNFTCSGLIGDFGTWTCTATVDGKDATANYLTAQHWSGEARAYYEQAAGGWQNNNGWTIKYEKTCTLPAGEYVLKVAARSSAESVATMSCSAATTINLPKVVADNAKGINTDGEASWEGDNFANGGKGYDWQWRYLPFSLDETTEVTMTFEGEAHSIHQYLSITDAELLSKTKLSQDITFDEAVENTIENVMIADVAITREIKDGFNTVVLPFDATANQVTEAFGEGVEVFAFSENSEDAVNATVNFNKGDGSITANTPVLIKVVSTRSSLEFTGVQIKAAEAKASGKNFDFIGTYAPVSVATGDYFVGNGAIYRSEGATNMNAFRAYISAKAEGARIAKFFIDGVEIEATGIEGLKTAKTANGKIYNLAGQEVMNAQKGLYIQNGKKIVIK